MSLRQFAVFGDPIAHSKSPLLHNSLFLELDPSASYGRYHLRESSELRTRFEALGLSGANITVPFKEVAFKQCDEARGIAREIGSVNTLVREEDRLIGYNTDAPGFFNTLRTTPQRALLLGAGGTAKALAAILRAHKIPLMILNRSEARLESFRLQGYSTATPESFTPDSFDLIINSTSAGLSDDSLPFPRALLEPLLHAGVVAYDVIYGKTTPFLALAKERGATPQDGREMLIEQAALSALHFTEHRFSLESIRALMHRALPA